jgi:hypothetical protein
VSGDTSKEMYAMLDDQFRRRYASRPPAEKKTDLAGTIEGLDAFTASSQT